MTNLPQIKYEYKSTITYLHCFSFFFSQWIIEAISATNLGDEVRSQGC